MWTRGESSLIVLFTSLQTIQPSPVVALQFLLSIIHSEVRRCLSKSSRQMSLFSRHSEFSMEHANALLLETVMNVAFFTLSTSFSQCFAQSHVNTHFRSALFCNGEAKFPTCRLRPTAKTSKFVVGKAS